MANPRISHDFDGQIAPGNQIPDFRSQTGPRSEKEGPSRPSASRTGHEGADLYFPFLGSIREIR
jgi:hypothetical protein